MKTLTAGKETKKPTCLALENVSKFFGKKRILEDICLTLPSGTILAIIGENGSGKTSLTNILSGFWRASHGQRISTGITQGKVSYLFQSTFLDAHLSIQNNLEIIALMKSQKITEFTDNVAHRLATIFNVSFAQKSKVKSLSQGQRRMLEFCIAIDPACDLLLLDEPTTHLDIHAKEKAIEWLRTILKNFIGISAICTHDSLEFDLCNEFIFLSGTHAPVQEKINNKSYRTIFSRCKMEKRS